MKKKLPLLYIIDHTLVIYVWRYTDIIFHMGMLNTWPGQEEEGDTEIITPPTIYIQYVIIITSNRNATWSHN